MKKLFCIITTVILLLITFCSCAKETKQMYTYHEFDISAEAQLNIIEHHVGAWQTDDKRVQVEFSGMGTNKTGTCLFREYNSITNSYTEYVGAYTLEENTFILSDGKTFRKYCCLTGYSNCNDKKLVLIDKNNNNIVLSRIEKI